MIKSAAFLLANILFALSQFSLPHFSGT